MLGCCPVPTLFVLHLPGHLGRDPGRGPPSATCQQRFLQPGALRTWQGPSRCTEFKTDSPGLWSPFSKGWEGKFSFPKCDSPFRPVLVPAKATNRVLETDDPVSLCEGLSARSDTSQQLQTSIQIAEVRSALKLASCSEELERSRDGISPVSCIFPDRLQELPQRTGRTLHECHPGALPACQRKPRACCRQLDAHLSGNMWRGHWSTRKRHFAMPWTSSLWLSHHTSCRLCAKEALGAESGLGQGARGEISP